MSKDTDENYDPYVSNGAVYLPHQCDEWLVGSRRELVALIQKLQALLKDEELHP